MRLPLVIRHFDAPLASELQRPRRAAVRLYWLGQAGFVIDTPDRRLVIDPYLSDSLAEKYRGTALAHERLHPPPVTVEDLGKVDLVLCTHQHGDHMDAGTLRPLAARWPELHFVVPEAAAAIATTKIGVGTDRLILANAGASISPWPGLTVTGLRAAHERLEVDDAGHHRFLGYHIDISGLRILHSGDTVPFDGQVAEYAALGPQLILLPVNGRSEALRQAGVPGNLTLEEAIKVGQGSGAAMMIAHHYGLFAFNTADPQGIDAAAAVAAFPVQRARFQIAIESATMAA
jgi:L-ascorbate metabolism protein UlaG (beta-lactamase superfamily)